MDDENNDLQTMITHALETMCKENGGELKKINLAEMERITNLARSKLRHLKDNGFKVTSNIKRAGTIYKERGLHLKKPDCELITDRIF